MFSKEWKDVEVADHDVFTCFYPRAVGHSLNKRHHSPLRTTVEVYPVTRKWLYSFPKGGILLVFFCSFSACLRWSAVCAGSLGSPLLHSFGGVFLVFSSNKPWRLPKVVDFSDMSALVGAGPGKIFILIGGFGAPWQVGQTLPLIRNHFKIARPQKINILKRSVVEFQCSSRLIQRIFEAHGPRHRDRRPGGDGQ